ncbi:MAG: hypothetical protein DMF89_14745 [Acidobacteria bacterium]|nr:MAG: hypothetical protein DMF89_14745 [Acidobacteriota bacterium]
MISDCFRARSQYLPYVGWALLLCEVLFWRLGVPTFWDPDEAHYAETTRELIATGDWLAPYYNQEPFFDKPILFHLLQAAAMWLFGATEFAARLVPALAALALILTTYWLGLVLCSAEVGLVAGLLLTLSPGVVALSRYAILDTLFTALLFGGGELVTVAALRGPRRLQYPGFVLIGLATLTKGPLAVTLCGIAFVIATTCSAEARRRLGELHWGGGIVIAVAIAAPWFLYMWGRFDSAFLKGYLLSENLVLFSKPVYGGQPGWYHYLAVFAVGQLPWTGLLLGRGYDHVRGAASGRRSDTFDVLLWSWTAAVVGFFSFSAFKLDHYIFPAAPAACLLCARAWADLRAPESDRFTPGTRVGRRLIGPTLALAGLAIGALMVARLALPAAALVGPSVLVIAGAVLTGRSLGSDRAGRHPRALWMSLSAIAVTYAGLLVWVLPAFEQQKVVPDLARWVADRASPTHRVATYRLNRCNPTFRFYVERHTIDIDTLHEAARFFDEPGPFYCAMVEQSYRELVARGAPIEIAYGRDGMGATSGRALWRQRHPATRFLIATRRAGTAPGRDQ